MPNDTFVRVHEDWKQESILQLDTRASCVPRSVRSAVGSVLQSMLFRPLIMIRLVAVSDISLLQLEHSYGHIFRS